MTGRGYKKYMKKEANKDYLFIKLFVLSFFGMLLFFTMLIKSFSPTVDVSIGDYKYESDIDNQEEIQKNIDQRLSNIQEEDTGKNFTDLMKNPQDIQEHDFTSQEVKKEKSKERTSDTEEPAVTPAAEPVYKVYIGNYSSSDQAKVAKEIIQESGSNLNPIVKCIGSNNYTLQVGLFKNKNSAEALLYTVQQNHLPGRIVQEY